MSAATTIAQAFGEGANLYTTVLGIKHPATENYSSINASQLRKAYYKRALLYHPDKQDPNTQTTDELEQIKIKFQAVSLAYTLLSDPIKRKEYDDHGELYDENDSIQDSSGTQAWAEYFRGIFGAVTASDIDKFTLRYKCSDEEEKDVLKYYSQFEGNLDKVLECVMCSSEVDKKRWVQDYILPAISNGKVEDHKDTLQRTLGQPIEDLEAIGRMEDDEDSRTETEEDSDPEEKRKKSGYSDKKKTKQTTQKKENKNKYKTQKTTKKKKSSMPDESLLAQIQGKSLARREKDFGNLIAGLEERYATAKKGSKKKKSEKMDDISDSEFDKIQARLESRRLGKKKL